MPSLDIFNDDAFSVHGLTASINNPPEGQVVPTALDALFNEEGVSTTMVSIERNNDSLTLVPATERGGVGDPTDIAPRDLVPFNLLHLPTPGSVMADEVQNVRAFGSETELEMVERLVQTKLLKMRKRLAATLAYHRLGAVIGRIHDANGTKVLLDLFTHLGVAQQTTDFDLEVDATDVLQKIRDSKRKSEDVISSSGMIMGWMGICGRGWFDAFVKHPETKEAFRIFRDGQFLRSDVRGGFEFGEVTWREYYGKLGSTVFIDPDVAYLVPVGVDDLFITRYGPANYVETVNTLGLPFYARQEPKKMGKGIDLEAQANWVNLCTKPRAIIKLTK